MGIKERIVNASDRREVLALFIEARRVYHHEAMKPKTFRQICRTALEYLGEVLREWQADESVDDFEVESLECELAAIIREMNTPKGARRLSEHKL